MLISTKGRYALRVMVDLAENSENGSLISLRAIAKRQAISEKYLENIMSTLVKADLLETHRGKGGGFRLTKKIEEYNLLTILKITEGEIGTVSCIKNGAVQCERCDLCCTLPIWKELNQVIENFLQSKTLDQLMKNPNII